MFAFRPGYGYAGFTDKYAAVNAPAEDGVFLIDMETGRSHLLVSYSGMGAADFSAEDKILVNHINMAPDSGHYVMLVRNFPNPDAGRKGWSTSLVMGDLTGNIRTVLSNTFVSHYRWVNARELIAFNRETDASKILLGAKSMMPPVVDVRCDLHARFSADGSWITFDTTHNDRREIAAIPADVLNF